jgi:hypothetical protein
MKKIEMPSEYWLRFEKMIDPRYDDVFKMLLRHAFYAGGISVASVVEDLADLPYALAAEAWGVASRDLMTNSDATLEWLESQQNRSVH